MSDRPQSGEGTGTTSVQNPADGQFETAEYDMEGMEGRPSSAQSKQAWSVGDDGLEGSPRGRENKGFRDEADLTAPTGMEHDDYGAEVNKYDPDDEIALENPEGCWAKFKGGVRSVWKTRDMQDELDNDGKASTTLRELIIYCLFLVVLSVSLWATRQTEDTEHDRELYIKTTLRELCLYIVFLIVLCILSFGMTSETFYYYTKVMSELFLDSQFPDTKNTFRGMTTMQDFWRFSENSLVDGLYWEKWYNDKNVTEEGFIFYENKLLGVPRLRQLKVRNDSCTVHDDFKNEILACYDAYAESIEEKEPFGKANGTAWTYQTEEELGGSSHTGQLASYSGAGYVENLGHNKEASKLIVAELKQNLWLDRGTRVVLVDFTVYNANINLFCIVRLVIEFPATGGALPSWSFRTVKLIRYVTVMDYFVMACEGIFVLFIIYYCIEEGIEIKKHRLAYFKSFWNILDMLVILISIICSVFNVYRTLKVGEILESLLDKPNEFPDFEFLSYWQVQFNNGIAVAVFFAWVKIFKYISFNKTMTQLSSTLGKCAKDLAGFAVMFFIIFLAFAQLGYLIFGTQVKDFRSFYDSIMTLFRIILGDFDFHELEAAHRVLGPIFFILYVFFVFFVLLNMFLAIINDTYSEVKADLSNQANEFEMGDYFKKGYDKMLQKLNLKRDKIVDLQKALNAADDDNDNLISFEEWRTDMKGRGFADSEIEAVFAKYDLDGNQVLDMEERAKMQADLEGQKLTLDKEFAEFDGKERPRSSHTTGQQRPRSQRRSSSRLSFGDESEDGSDDEESGTRSSGGKAVNGVSYEEFTVLSRRVDRMEHSIGSIVSKIDAVLVKLEAMEKAKMKRRETMGKILDSITESDGGSDETKRDQMEKLVREELERWDSDASIPRGSSPSGSGASAGARNRNRSRPNSGNQHDYDTRQSMV